jgi:hypothetical protein
VSNIRVCPINFYDQAGLVESPAMVTTMPATNAQNTDRGSTARSTSAAAQTIQGAWGGDARKIDSFFMYRHNCQGANVQLLLYPNSDYTGTPYDSTALPFFTAVTSNSFDWGITAAAPDSVNDLLLAEAPYFLYFAAFTAKSFKIILTNCARTYFDITRIWLGKFLEAPYNPKYGMTVGESYGDLPNRTKGGSLRTRSGAKWHELKIDTFYLDDAGRQLWSDLISFIQLNKDVAISVLPGVGGRQERDRVWNMQLQAGTQFAWNNINLNEAVFSFTEL